MTEKLSDLCDSCGKPKGEGIHFCNNTIAPAGRVGFGITPDLAGQIKIKDCRFFATEENYKTWLLSPNAESADD